MKTPNTLLLSLAIATALSACSGDKAPAASASVEAAPPPKAELPPLAAFNIADLDTSKNACTNLADFVNSKWLAANPVPGDKTAWGSFEMLDERSVAASKALVEAAIAKPDASGVEKLVGDIYATGMDEAAINAAGITPLQPMLDRIDAIKTPSDIAGYLRDEFAAGRGEVFGFYPQADFKKSDTVIAYADQGGLSLPEKAYYLEDGADGKYKTIRDAFVAHIAKQLQNAGVAADAAQKQANDVLAFETRLAKASFSRIELRDPSRQYHYVSVTDADKASPNFSWSEFFAANGIKVDGFSQSQPKFFVEFNKMLADVPVEQWQAYLRINAIDGMAPFLATKLNDERFDFYSRTLRGQKEQKPRWKRVLDTVEGSTGEALGQLYVKEYFPAESKAAMETLVGNLREALKARLEKLDW
ncbi:MAG: M13 family metallopeptidase N-terminal domain-containing protein, partial [Thermomonas sp.]